MSEHLDVLIVGAGLSGIGAACHLRKDSPDTTFAVLESRATSGGTWDLFRYPGVRSDSDMFTLGYGFRPWSQATAVAGGSTILHYLRDTAQEYGIDRDIRYGHRVIAAAWSSEDALARLLLRPRRSGAIRTLQGIFWDRSWITPERIETTLALAARPHAAATLTELVRELGTVRGIRPGWRESLLRSLRPHGIPTLLVWGERDLVLPAAHLDAARHALPDSEFHLLPGTGHMPQIERADEFAALALDFVARHPVGVSEHHPTGR